MLLNKVVTISFLKVLAATLICYFTTHISAENVHFEKTPPPDSVVGHKTPDEELLILKDSLFLEIEGNRWQQSMVLCTKISNKCFEAKRYGQAIDFCLQALKISDEKKLMIKNQTEQDTLNKLTGDVELCIANVYSKLHNHETAIEFYKKAIKRFEEINDTALLLPAINSLALAYNNFGQPEEAMLYFLNLIEIAVAFADSSMIASAYNNIGLVEYGKQNYKPAYKNFIEAGKIYNCLNDKREAASFYNIGILQGYLGNYDSTVVYYLKALDILTKNNDLTGIAKVQMAIAQFYYSKGQYKKSEQFLFDALQNSKEVNAMDFIIDIYGYLARLMEKNGRYKEAYEYLQIHQQKHDSMYFRQQEHIAEMQKRYENEKMEREIELLNIESQIKGLTLQKQKNRQKYLIITALLALLVLMVILSLYRLKIRTNKKLNHQKQELELANATKDKFFSIIAHDLRNLVFSTSNFSEVLHRDFEKLTNAQKVKLISGLYKSSSLTSQLTDDLIQWAMSQTGRLEVRFEKCNINEIIDHEISLAMVNAIKRNIQINNVLPEEMHIVADKNMTALIIRNLISNAIKFSSAGSQIKISGKYQNDYVEIAVEDQGEGILPEDIPKLFRTDINTSTIRTAGQKGTGLGLILCKDFVEKNGGTIKAESMPGKGSIFTFTLQKTK